MEVVVAHAVDAASRNISGIAYPEFGLERKWTSLGPALLTPGRDIFLEQYMRNIVRTIKGSGWRDNCRRFLFSVRVNLHSLENARLFFAGSFIPDENLTIDYGLGDMAWTTGMLGVPPVTVYRQNNRSKSPSRAP